MSTPLLPINLTGAVVGTKGTIDLTNCAPSTNSAYTNQVATLQMYNESGCGLRLSGENTSLGIDLPAGGWNNVALSYGESAINYVVMYVLPNAAVNLLLATYYAPNEPIQAGPAAALGNSPVNIGNSVPLSATATAVVNDGNVSGTQVGESSLPGPHQTFLWLNDGTFQVSPETNGVFGDPALQVVPGGAAVFATVGMDNGSITTDGKGNYTAANGAGNGNITLKDDTTASNRPKIALMDVKVGGKEWSFYLMTDGSLLIFEAVGGTGCIQPYPDGHVLFPSGRGLFAQPLSGATKTLIDIFPSDRSVDWAFQDDTSDNLFIGIAGGQEVLRMIPGGGSGIKLSGVGGVMRAWSHFTGGATGNYNHNLGTTPNVVLCMQSTSGSETLGWDTPTGTQVHITNPTGNTWVGLALLMA